MVAWRVVWTVLLLTLLVCSVRPDDYGRNSNKKYMSQTEEGEAHVVVFATGPEQEENTDPERPQEDGDFDEDLEEQHPRTRSSYPMCRMGYGIMDHYPTQDGFYQHQTCFWCYHFIPSHRKNHDLEIVREVVTLDDRKPRYDIKFKVENDTYHFDPDNEESWQYVVEAMVDVLEANKLEDCCRDAVTCCEKALDDPPGVEEDCPRTWDGWACFPDTPPATTVTFTCPAYGYKGRPDCALTARKECWDNGTWARNEKNLEQTDYSSCSHKHYHLVNYAWEAAMHAVSITALLPAIILLLWYRQLRVQKFYLHLNFFCALLGKALFNLLDLLVLRVPEYTGTNTLMDDNTAGCKVLVFLTKMFSLAVWTWMLAESIYLHRLIFAAFKGGGKTYVYVIIGWVPAVVLSVCWAVSRVLLEDYHCWLGDDMNDAGDLYLITELPKMIILIVNTFLLGNMTWVLLTKLRGVHDDNSTAIRTAVKATSFLLPLFGLQFFCTFFIPPASSSCAGMQVYMFLAMGADGLQGFYVAIVYCFLSKEVKLQVRRSVYQLQGRFAPDRSYVASYDPRTDVTLLHSGAANSVATATSTVD